MPIAPRAQSHNHSNPHRAHDRLPPTQSVLSLAAYRLADELGGRDLEQADRDDAASRIYDFAAKSVATAWSLVDAAVMAVRTLQARRMLNRERGNVLDEFLKELDAAREGDLKARAKLIEEIKAEGTGDERKREIEGELKELLLRGIPQGRSWKLGEKTMVFFLDAMRREFMPIRGSPMARQDFPRFVKGNVQFLNWLGTSLLFSEAQVLEYQAAKDKDKAASAQAAAQPAPETDATEENDSDVAEDEGEETVELAAANA